MYLYFTLILSIVCNAAANILTGTLSGHSAGQTTDFVLG
jgi:hypothetical protein